jgi:AraC-like DNA-binding protein
MSQSRHSAPLVPGRLERSLGALSEDPPAGSRIPPHRHPFAQLIYAARGVMTVRTDDGVWVVPPERAVWVPPYVGHSIQMNGSVALRTIYLDPALAPIEGPQCCVVQVSALLRAAILRAVDFGPAYPESGREARLVSVIVDEIHDARTAPLHLPMPSDPRARRVADALGDDPGDKRTLRDWSRVAGASERTLERLFRDETALSFGAWRQQARLLHALERLAVGDSVTDVALRLGFEGPSAFIAMFRKAMGTTPGRYFRAPAAS